MSEHYRKQGNIPRDRHRGVVAGHFDRMTFLDPCQARGEGAEMCRTEGAVVYLVDQVGW